MIERKILATIIFSITFAGILGAVQLMNLNETNVWLVAFYGSVALLIIKELSWALSEMLDRKKK